MAVGVATFHVKHLATRAFGGEIGTRSGNVSRETVRRVSVRAKTGKGRCATEKRQRPAFPCVGELSRLGKTFHVKRRALGCRSQLLRAQTRHLAQNARLFENVSRETPVSFECYKQQPRARTRPFARNALFESVSRETNKQSSFGKFYKIRRAL